MEQNKTPETAVKEITLEKHGESPSIGFRPANFEELWRFATLISKTDMVPKEFSNNAGKILAAVQMGHELGLPPMQSLQHIAVINGRPSLWGDGALAVVRAHPMCESMLELDPNDALVAGYGECIIKRRGQVDRIIRRFTLEQAKAAGLMDRGQTAEAKAAGPWQRYRGRMLQMRARAWCMRDAIPEALKGIAIREEQYDMQPNKAPTSILQLPKRLEGKKKMTAPPPKAAAPETEGPEAETPPAKEPEVVEDPDGGQRDIFPLTPGREPGAE